MSTPLYRDMAPCFGYAEALMPIYHETTIENKDDKFQKEILDDELISWSIKLAIQKKLDEALKILASVWNFEKMASSFMKIANYIENKEQLEKIVEVAGIALTPRYGMTKYGEMRKLSVLRDNTLEYLISKAEKVV